LRLLGTHSREKHAVDPAQFGTPPAFLKSFGQRFSIRYRLESFRGAVSEAQGFRL
jgi:hypothetical protein